MEIGPRRSRPGIPGQPPRDYEADSQWRFSVKASDPVLVRACLAGKEKAWNLLVERYAPLIYSVPHQFELAEEDAADIFHNVCVSLWRNLSSLRDSSSLAPWLIQAAQNECLEVMLRRGGNGAPTVAPADAHTLLTKLQAEGFLPPDLAHQLTEGHRLRLAFGKLPERSQQLLRLLYLDPGHLSDAEIAARLGIPPTAVGAYRARCLEHLRRLLEAEGVNSQS